MLLYIPLKLSKLLSGFLSKLGTAPGPPDVSTKYARKSDFFMISVDIVDFWSLLATTMNFPKKHEKIGFSWLLFVVT